MSEFRAWIDTDTIADQMAEDGRLFGKVMNYVAGDNGWDEDVTEEFVKDARLTKTAIDVLKAIVAAAEKARAEEGGAS